MIGTFFISAILATTNVADDNATPRGITGSVTISHSGDPLQAKLDQDLSSPLLVRVTDLSGADPTSEHRYRIDYIGAVAGSFDLRSMITHRDGTPATEIAPIPVKIVSELPEKFGSDLFIVSAKPLFARSYYRVILGLIAAIWIAIPIFVFVRRAIRNRPAPPAPPPPPAPTLADQLRPLVEGAMNQGLSVPDQARLELLLMAFWSERRNFAALQPAEAIEKLRTDPEASTLLLAIERWLHARGGASPQAAQGLSQLLDPYRGHAPIAVAEVSQ